MLGLVTTTFYCRSLPRKPPRILPQIFRWLHTTLMSTKTTPVSGDGIYARCSHYVVLSRSRSISTTNLVVPRQNPCPWMGVILIELNFIHQVAIMNHQGGRRRFLFSYFGFGYVRYQIIHTYIHLEFYTETQTAGRTFLELNTYIHIEFRTFLLITGNRQLTQTW